MGGRVGCWAIAAEESRQASRRVRLRELRELMRRNCNELQPIGQNRRSDHLRLLRVEEAGMRSYPQVIDASATARLCAIDLRDGDGPATACTGGRVVEESRP